LSVSRMMFFRNLVFGFGAAVVGLTQKFSISACRKVPGQCAADLVGSRARTPSSEYFLLASLASFASSWATPSSSVTLSRLAITLKLARQCPALQTRLGGGRLRGSMTNQENWCHRKLWQSKEFHVAYSEFQKANNTYFYHSSTLLSQSTWGKGQMCNKQAYQLQGSNMAASAALQGGRPYKSFCSILTN
jgi:hypothetical protein